MKIINLLLSLVLLSICIKAQQENTIIYGEFDYPKTFAPISNGQASEYRIAHLIFDSLLKKTSGNDFIYSIAKDIDVSPNGLSYTFLLRDHLQWNDGTPLTEKDVEFTLRLILNPETYNYNSTLADYIDSFECNRANMITIKLSKPFIVPWVLFTFPIFPKHKFSNPVLSKDDPFHQNPLGSGAFYIADKQEKSITLQASSYNSKNSLQKIIIQFYDNKKDAWDALQQNKIQMVTDIPIENIKNHPKNIIVKPYTARYIHILGINYRNNNSIADLIQQVRFRKILSNIIDKNAILKNCFQNNGNILTGLYPIHNRMNDTETVPQSYDEFKTQDDLEHFMLSQEYEHSQTGWQKQGHNISFSLKYQSGDDEIQNACQEICNMFKNFGLTVSLLQRSKEEFQDEVEKNGDFDLAYYTYHFENIMDIFPLLHSGKSKITNFSGYRSTQLEELLLQLKNSMNPWMIQKYSEQVHQYVVQEQLHLFLWELPSYVAYTERLKNFQAHSYSLFHFSEN